MLVWLNAATLLVLAQSIETKKQRRLKLVKATGCCDLLLEQKMDKALRAYATVLRLIRRLPKDTRPYYAKYARENFVNYREVDANDASSLDELFHRAYNHSIWVLNKVLDSYLLTFLYIVCTYKCLCIRVYWLIFEFLMTHLSFSCECSIR